jgi:hypothetical protein
VFAAQEGRRKNRGGPYRIRDDETHSNCSKDGRKIDERRSISWVGCPKVQSICLKKMKLPEDFFEKISLLE